MRILVALGGNALLKRGEPMTAEAQRANVQVAARSLAPIAEQHELVISHGNGPQVGLLALQASAYTEVEAYPLDVLGAQTEGMIGYLIEQELGNLLPPEAPLATLLTMIEVSSRRSCLRRPDQVRRAGVQRRGGVGAGRREGLGVQARRRPHAAGRARHRSPSGSSSSGPSSGCWSTRPS